MYDDASTESIQGVEGSFVRVKRAVGMLGVRKEKKIFVVVVVVVVAVVKYLSNDLAFRVWVMNY